MGKKILNKLKSKSGWCMEYVGVTIALIVAILMSIDVIVYKLSLPKFENDIDNEICEMEDYKLSKEQVIEKVTKLTDKKRSVLFSTIKCTDASVDLIYKEDDSRTYRVTYKINKHSYSKNIVIKEDKGSQD